MDLYPLLRYGRSQLVGRTAEYPTTRLDFRPTDCYATIRRAVDRWEEPAVLFDFRRPYRRNGKQPTAGPPKADRRTVQVQPATE